MSPLGCWCYLPLSLLLFTLGVSSHPRQLDKEAGPQTGEANCSALASSFQFPNSSLLAVSYYRNGTTIDLPGLVPSCATGTAPVNATTNLCRIVISVNTTNSSNSLVEGWLPDAWNQRFLGTGGGGISGCVDYSTISYASSFGFASFGTNGGHNGSSGYQLFLNQPEVKNDYGYRALHVEVEAAKAIISQYYGKPPAYRYYAGCSTGGRQGIKNALTYPDDFDGILAGAPGVHWYSLASSYALFARRAGWPNINTSSYVRQDQWQAIVQAQINLYDDLDGIKDGVIDTPYLYTFDANLLRCGGGILNDSVCLSPQQAVSVASVYEPIFNSTGAYAVPAWGIGSDTSAWSQNVVNGTPSFNPLITNIFRGLIYDNPTWSPNNFNITDLEYAVRTDPGGVETGGTDLSAFYKKGGKLLSYHGGYDSAGPFENTLAYYDGVGKTLNLTTDQLQSFFRLIYVNGMYHCSGGPGAWNIGQNGPFDARLNSTTHNVLLALVEWTEGGNAPDYLIGSSVAKNGTISSQRKHCVYPQSSKWNKTGSPSVASSWQCNSASVNSLSGQ